MVWLPPCYQRLSPLFLDRNRQVLVGEFRQFIIGADTEREAAYSMAERLKGKKHRTMGADKGYDASELADDLRGLHITPHIAQRKRSKSMGGRTTRHKGYAISQRKRKRIEEIFGWAKTVGLIRKARMRGIANIAWLFMMSMAVFNLVRMRNMEAEA